MFNDKTTMVAINTIHVASIISIYHLKIKKYKFLYKMTIISFKNDIDPSLLTIGIPVKQEDKSRVMEVKYDSSPLMFKTPRVKFNKSNGELYFNVASKPVFMNFFNNLEDSVLKNVSENSPALFGGRMFSVETVRDRIKRFWDIDEETNSAVVRPGYFDRDTIKCYDVFGDPVGFDDVSSHVSAILDVRGLRFKKNLFEIELGLSRLKMSRFESKEESPFQDQVASSADSPADPETESPGDSQVNPTIEEDNGDFFTD
jgi:hypothetical protein